MSDNEQSTPASAPKDEPDQQRSPEEIVTGTVSTTGTRKDLNSKRNTVIAVTASIVVVALALFGLYWVANFKKVPDVIGMTAAEAESVLAETTFTATLGSTDTSIGKEHFDVVGQSPDPGAFLKKTSEVTITLEPQKNKVPKLEGLALKDAEALAEKNYFSITTIPGLSLDPEWVVEAQSVKAGKDAPKGTNIELKIELPMVKVPDLSGKTLQEAIDLLAEKYLDSTISGSGPVVISQRPAPNESMKAWEKVEFVAGVKFPKLSAAYPPKTAAETLKKEGFTNVTINGPESGYITEVNVATDALVSLDTPVVITSAPSGITYRITGNGSIAAITYAAPNGSFNIQQETSAALPWEKFFEGASGSSNFNAQILDGDSITCTVIRNGVETKSLTSTGMYAFIQC